MTQKVADKLVEMLVDAGVKRVYGITGDSLNPVNDAIRRDGRLQWIHVRHEEAGAYAASMDAELNGIGCCMGSSGPGHVHLINGLYDANRAGNPVIAIASTIHSDKFAQETFQDTNPTLLFQDCSQFVAVASTPAQFAHMMQAAIQQATEKRGVAVLALPGDVASADAAEIETAQRNYRTRSVYRPSDDELDQLAELLNDPQHQNIALYCGIGCKDAVDDVLLLAQTLQSPLAFSFRGKIFFDKSSNPYATGLNGLLGERAGYRTCNEADVLLMLGTDFPYTEFMPQEGTHIVQIDARPERLGRRAKVDMGLAGDIGDTLRALQLRLTRRENSDFLQEMRQEYAKDQKHLSEFAVPEGKPDTIAPEYVARVLNEYADDDAIFTVDTGMGAVWGARFIDGGRARSMTGSFNHGSMANAMPMALGAALGGGGRQVIALCGDGGLSMLLGDLMTIAQYKLPVKVMVFNNRALGMVKLEMEVAGYVDWQTDMVNPNFAAVAQAMGIRGVEVHEASEVESAIREALAYDGPVLLDIYTDPNALAMPPHVTAGQTLGFAKSMFRKLMAGQMDEILDTVKSNIGHAKEIL